MKKKLLKGIQIAGLEKQMKIMALFVFLLLMGIETASARGSDPQVTPEWQQSKIRITGMVVDRTGDPIVGVNIVEKSVASNGTITDADGNFSLNVSPGATLTVSYIGYVTQELAVGNQTQLQIILQEDLQMLEEVVVVGYGTKRKGDITSAISVIDMDNIGDVHGLDASRLIQGQAPGVVVKQKSGTPGREMDITIRGLGSLGASSAPLYVVDGFPIGTSAQQSLNPNDIESISILKDAASTAIYGARGANGVILITTKGAKEGELRLNFDASYGIQNIPDNRRTKVMNGVEYAYFKKESFEDRIRYFENREPSLEEVPISFRYPEETKYSTDWFEEIVNNNASVQNYNVTLSEGAGKIRSVLSVGYLKQEGAVIKTNFERFNARANIQGEFNEYIAVGWNIAGSRSNERLIDTEGRNAMIGQTYTMDPREPVYNEDGTWKAYIGGYDGLRGFPNPVMLLHETKNIQHVNRLISSGYIEITFLKDFKFKPSVNVSLLNLRRNDFRPSTVAGTNAPPPRNAAMAEWDREILNYSADLLLTYNKKIGDHAFDAMLGYTAQEENYAQMYGSGSKFPNDEIRIFQNAETFTVSSEFYDWSLLAYFARVGYNFKDRYLFSASFRREGSSRFGADNKWGTFPSASLGWRISEEPFMPRLSWLSNLKLRASYGVTGNNGIGNYPSLAGLNSANYILGGSLAPGATLSSFSNAQLGWERSNALDLGLDMSLFDNKLIFTAEYYNRITDNMLLSRDIPIITGFSSTYTNVGKVQNRGVELAVDYKNRITKDLNLRGNFNITFNRNKVLEIMGENDYMENYNFYNYYNRSVVGEPIGMYYGYKMLGIFNTEEEIANSPKQDGAIPGVYKYWDADGNGEVTYDALDMVVIGNPHPKFVWALTLAADYRNFDLNILFTGAQGYDLIRNIEQTLGNLDGLFNVSKDAQYRWRSAENPGKGLYPTTNTWKWEREVSSRYVYDASHAWLKSLSLGYTIPRGSKLLKGARFFLNVENLFLITNYPGSNPDIDLNGGINPGRDDEAYPVPRIFSIGTTISF
jgi:TonB-linked SusC/RagA family outer membrane protein